MSTYLYVPAPDDETAQEFAAEVMSDAIDVTATSFSAVLIDSGPPAIGLTGAITPASWLLDAVSALFGAER